MFQAFFSAAVYTIDINLTEQSKACSYVNNTKKSVVAVDEIDIKESTALGRILLI
jgi:hypothetical protein